MALSNEELANILQQGTAGGNQLDLPEPFVPGQQGIFSQGAESLFGQLNLGGRRGDILGRLFGNVLPPSKKQKELQRLQLEGKAQKRTRARQGAVQEFSDISGVSAQGVATGAGFNQQLQGVLEATARGEQGGRQGLTALAQTGPRPTAARALALSDAETARTRATDTEARAVESASRAERALTISEGEEARKEALAARQKDPLSLESLTRAIETSAAESQLLGQPEPGPGQATIISQVTGQPQIVNLEGTKEFTAERKRLLGAQNALRLSGQLADLTERAGTSGTEFFGPLAVEMSSKRSQLMSSIFQSRGLGAPQTADIKLVGAGLPDPTDFFANVRGIGQGAIPGLAGSMKAEFVAGFNEAGAEAEQTLQDILLETPQLINEVDQGLLDPGGELFELVEKLRTGE